MGDVTEMILDGVLCECCGAVIDDATATGYSRLCDDCADNEKVTYVVVDKSNGSKAAGEYRYSGLIGSGNGIRTSYKRFICFHEKESAEGFLKNPAYGESDMFYVRRANKKELKLLEKNNKKYRKWLRNKKEEQGWDLK